MLPPNMENLIEQGYKKQKLQTSDFMWNWVANDCLIWRHS